MLSVYRQFCMWDPFLMSEGKKTFYESGKISPASVNVLDTFESPAMMQRLATYVLISGGRSVACEDNQFSSAAIFLAVHNFYLNLFMLQRNSKSVL